MIDAGVDPATIPDAWLPAIIAAMSKWISATPAGAGTFARIMGLEFKQGSPDKTYTLLDDPTRKVKPSELYYMYGIVLNGRPYPPHLVEISDVKLEQCDDCGIRSHCMKTVRDPRNDRMLTLCNYCLTLNDNFTLREFGDMGLCGPRCPRTSCTYHPKAAAALASAERLARG